MVMTRKWIRPQAKRVFYKPFNTDFLPKQLLAIMQGWPDKTAQLPGRRVCTFFQGRVRAREFYFLKGYDFYLLLTPPPPHYKDTRQWSLLYCHEAFNHMAPTIPPIHHLFFPPLSSFSDCRDFNSFPLFQQFGRLLSSLEIFGVLVVTFLLCCYRFC